MDETARFELERPRLLRLAARILRDSIEAQDVVQHAWLRLHASEAVIDNLPAWLTTVTTRLCLDRLRSPNDIPVDVIDIPDLATNPADDLELADSLGGALQVVLDRLTPHERVAFVLHDSFAVDFATIATILDVTPASARKLASRGRGKLTAPPVEGGRADWRVVDAFLAAARNGKFEQLLALLAPDVVIASDHAAVLVGSPARIEGRAAVATMFNGAAKAALPVLIDGRPGAAWFLRGSPQVAFDFTIGGGVVTRIVFRADPAVLDEVIRRSEEKDLSSP